MDIHTTHLRSMHSCTFATSDTSRSTAYNEIVEVIIRVYHGFRSCFNEIDIKADFVFLDGSHEENDVYMDLYYYYQLVNEGGHIWGDDYGWEGVYKALDRFCEDNSIQYNILQNRVHWFINK